MAWRLADTPENRKLYPALAGKSFIGMTREELEQHGFFSLPHASAAQFEGELSDEDFVIPTPSIANMEVRCPCDCRKLPEFTQGDIRAVLNYLDDPARESAFPKGIPFLSERLLEGMNVEREHCDITGGDPILTAKISLSHLREDPEYYVKLKKAGL